MNIKGKLVRKMDVENGTSKNGKEWQKQLILIDDLKYNPTICIQAFGDKVGLISGLEIGKEYNFSININSREFKGKYYTNIDLWKVDKVEVEEVESEDIPF